MRGSFLTLELPAASCICAVGEVVNYLVDPTNSAEALAGFLRRAFAALEPGGLLLLDPAAPGRAAGGTRHFSEGDGWAVGALAHEGPDGILVRRITSFRRNASGSWRRSYEEHRLRLWTREQMLGLLAAAGFTARTGQGYGDLALPPGLVSYFAVKPGAEVSAPGTGTTA